MTSAGTERQERKHAQKNPNGGHTDSDFGKQIAGLGSEGALTAHAAERARQTAAFAALDQDQHDQEGRS